MKRLFCINKKAVFNLAAALIFMLASLPVAFAMECLSSEAAGTISPPGADQPSDLAIGPDGNMYLVDGVNNRIVVMSAEGALKFAFGRKGGGPGEFSYPMGIDISSKGRVFIADTGNHRIQVFDLKGALLYQFPARASADKRPAAPVDVLALDRKNYLYVSDKDNHEIKVFSQDGAYQFEWGGFGEFRGKFRYPGMLAVDAFNQIYVVDVLNTRVQEFDPDGNFIREIGAWGVSPGDLFRPKGVAIDKTGRVFISDSYMGCVQVFSDLGGFSGVVCENGKKNEFTTPVGLAFDARNRLHVVEMRANRIRILKVTE
jgi:DNA-binding beta-propeller fold protein YncE